MRSSCWTCQVVDFLSRNYYAEFRGGMQETYIQQKIEYIDVHVQRVQGLDRHAERTATLALASCPTAAAVLRLEEFCCRCRTAVLIVVVCYEKLCGTSQVVDFSYPKYFAEFRGGKQETYNKNRVRVYVQRV